MMQPTPGPRPLAQRIADTKRLLDETVDCWVATADARGRAPHLVPLSHTFDGETILLATSASSPTGRALTATGRVRIGFGLTRDVVMVDGIVETIERADLPEPEADRFADRAGFDPRRLPSFRYFRVRPTAVQAWREENELAGRDLMRDGAWLPD